MLSFKGKRKHTLPKGAFGLVGIPKAVVALRDFSFYRLLFPD
jgi:hypothetical protein